MGRVKKGPGRSSMKAQVNESCLLKLLWMPLGPPTQLRVGRRVDQCPDLAGLNRIPPDFGLLPASLPASKEPSPSQSKVGLCQSPEITPPRPSTEHLICPPLSLPIKAHLFFAQADLTPMRIHYASKAQRLDSRSQEK